MPAANLARDGLTIPATDLPTVPVAADEGPHRHQCGVCKTVWAHTSKSASDDAYSHTCPNPGCKAYHDLKRQWLEHYTGAEVVPAGPPPRAVKAVPPVQMTMDELRRHVAGGGDGYVYYMTEAPAEPPAKPWAVTGPLKGWEAVDPGVYLADLRGDKIDYYRAVALHRSAPAPARAAPAAAPLMSPVRRVLSYGGSPGGNCPTGRTVYVR